MITYKIIKELLELSKTDKTAKILSIVSWNDSDPVFDIHSWADDRKRCYRGCTFSFEEMKKLKEALDEMEFDSLRNEIAGLKRGISEKIGENRIQRG